VYIIIINKNIALKLYFISCFRLNLVFFILLLHGIGALMPWNMFITAKDVSQKNNDL